MPETLLDYYEDLESQVMFLETLSEQDKKLVQSEMKGIKKTLEILNIKVSGINQY